MILKVGNAFRNVYLRLFACALTAWIAPACDAAQITPALAAYYQARQLIASKEYDAAIDTLRKLLEDSPSFDRGYLWLAYCYRESGRHDDALKYFEASPNPIFGLAMYHKVRREYGAAIELFQKYIDTAPRYLPAYTHLAEAAYWSGSVENTEQFLRKRIEASPEAPEPLYGLGYLFRLRNDWANAERWLKQAARLAPDDEEILSPLAESLYRTVRHEEALALLDRVLGRIEASADPEREGPAIGLKGMIHSDQGDYEEAMGALQRAADCARQMGDRRREEILQANLGFVYYYLARYGEALSEIRAALRLATELGLDQDRGRNIGLIGLIYTDLAEYAKAIDAFEQALRIARQTKDRASEADQMASLSRVHSAVGDYVKALEHAHGALVISKELKNPWLEGRFHQMLGSVYRHLGRLTDALESYRRGLNLARQVGDKTRECERLALASEIQALLGHRTVAGIGFEEALGLARQIGALRAETGILINLAKLHLKAGATELASRHFREALAIARRVRLREVIWQAHAGLAAVYERQGGAGDALREYEQAVRAIEDVRAGLSIPEDKAGFLADKLDVFRRLIRLLVTRHRRNPNAGYDRQAFHYTERAKARAFLDSIAEPKLPLDGTSDPGLRDRQKRLETQLSQLQSRLLAQYSRTMPDRARIEALQTELSRADDEYAALRREIRQKLPAYAAFRYPEPISLDQARARLDPREVLLEYSVGAGSAFLIAVAREGIVIANIPPAGFLVRRVERLRQAISRGPGRVALANYVSEATALYRELIQPAARLLRGKDQLVVIPDGPLHLLPFSALLKDVTTPRDGYGGLPYLVKNYSIRYAPSASALFALAGRARSADREHTLAAFGDPDYGALTEAGGGMAVRSAFSGESPLRFARLGHSREEVERIARLYPGKAALFLGARASEEKVKARISQFRIVHFAVHGIADRSRPQFSGLVLSSPRNGSVEDSLLQAYEIAGLRLNADLVVLSACETRLGKNVEGEGLVGLTQAFLYAGAATVVSTLWNVADRGSVDLMERFHRNLNGGDKARSLQRAQLDLIRQTTFSHPYFWSGFSVIGAAR